jgi:hypothetical protein
MRSRCLNPKVPAYKDYGGRGITICQEWLTFYGFFEDMGEAPEGMELERIDNDGPYCKANCRWAPGIEQARNKRNNRWVEFEGKRQLLADLERQFKIPYLVLYKRIFERLWPVEKAVSTPIRKTKQKECA